MLLFKNKPLKLKFTNLIEFELVNNGLSYSNLFGLFHENAGREIFFKAWSIVLNENLTEQDFFELLQLSEDFEDENDVEIMAIFLTQAKEEVLRAWERDCYIKKENKEGNSSRDNSFDLLENYNFLKEFVCQNCNFSRAEFDNATPKETNTAIEVYKNCSFKKIIDVHFARLLYSKVADKKSKLEDFEILKKSSPVLTEKMRARKLNAEMQVNEYLAKRKVEKNGN